MKKSRFSDSQILSILKQAEGGAPVPELCREHGMSSATFHKWRRRNARRKMQEARNYAGFRGINY